MQPLADTGPLATGSATMPAATMEMNARMVQSLSFVEGWLAPCRHNRAACVSFPVDACRARRSPRRPFPDFDSIPHARILCALFRIAPGLMPEIDGVLRISPVGRTPGCASAVCCFLYGADPPRASRAACAFLVACDTR